MKNNELQQLLSQAKYHLKFLKQIGVNWYCNKYNNKEDFELIGEGVANTSILGLESRFICKIKVGTRSIVGITIFDWRMYYLPIAGLRGPLLRNFENEPSGNFKYTWPVIRSYIDGLLISWHNSMIFR